MKVKKIGAVLLTVALAVSLVACADGGQKTDSGNTSKDSAGGEKRVCFVARASADTFAAWLTKEMKEAAKTILL